MNKPGFAYDSFPGGNPQDNPAEIKHGRAKKIRKNRNSDIHHAESSDSPSIGSILAKFKRIGLKDLAVFSWQLYTMVEAGIPIIRSLNSIVRQTNNERLKVIIGQVIDDISRGMSFSEALRKHPKVFSPFFIGMIEVGEVGGALDKILADIAKYYETSVERRSKIISALSYPALLMAGCIGVVGFLIMFLVPKLFVMFENIGADVPYATMVLITVGQFARNNMLFIAGGIAALIIGLKLYRKTPSGEYAFDRFLLAFPIAGSILRKIILSRFSHSMSIMTNSGVPLLSSLRITRDIVGNAAVVRVVDDLIDSVSEGDSINEVLSRHSIIPDMVVNMVAVGEETGTLGTMLTKVAGYYDREVNSAIGNLTKIIEPVLLVGMAGVVGFIAVSILDPVTDLITNMNR